MKITPCLAAATAAVFVLAGCSGGSTTPAAEQASAPGPAALPSGQTVEISFWHSLGDVPGQTLQQLIDEFNTANSGKIKVNASYQGTNTDALAKYRAAAGEGNTPSVILAYDASTGYLNDVQQTISASALAKANPDDLDLKDISPAGANYYNSNGEQLAVPFAVSMPLLYVNKEALKKAGITDTSSLKTLNGVATAAKEVKSKVPGVSGLVQPFDGWWFEQLTAASGAAYCSPDNGRKGSSVEKLDIPASAEEAIKTVSDLYTTGVGLDTGLKGGDASNAFISGKTAMLFNSSAAAGTIRKSAAFDYEVLPYPTSGPADSSGPVIGGSALWVNAKGHTDAEQVASWKLISFLSSAASQEKFSQATGFAPINVKVGETETNKSFLQAHPDAAAIAAQFKATPATTATAGCLSGALPSIRNAVVPQMQAAFSGQKPLSDAISAAEGDATKAISDYLKQVQK